MHNTHEHPHAQTHTRAHTCTRPSTFTQAHKQTHKCTNTHTYTNTQMHEHTYTRKLTNAQAHIHTQTHKCTNTHTYAASKGGPSAASASATGVVVARLDAAQEAIEQGNAQLVNEQGPVLVGGVCVHVYAIALCVIALYAVAFCVPLCVVVSFAIALNKSLCWWVPLHRPLHHQHTHAHTHTHIHTQPCPVYTPHTFVNPHSFFNSPRWTSSHVMPWTQVPPNCSRQSHSTRCPPSWPLVLPQPLLLLTQQEPPPPPLQVCVGALLGGNWLRLL